MFNGDLFRTVVRTGGNLLLNLGNCFSNICFLEFAMDSRLRGNDGGEVLGVVCS